MKHSKRTNFICRQAIETKYLGPTNTRGSRIKATCAAGTVVVHWKHELNPEQNHMNAAWALVEKLGWDKTSRVVGLHAGQLKTGNYCFILKEKK